MDIQNILKLIMEEHKCSPVTALLIYSNMINNLKKEVA